MIKQIPPPTTFGFKLHFLVYQNKKVIQNAHHRFSRSFMTLPNCPVTARLGGTAGAEVAAAASPRRARGRAVASLGEDDFVPKPSEGKVGSGYF